MFTRSWKSHAAAEQSATGHFSITQGDTSAADFPSLSRSIYVGVAGDIAVVTEDDNVEIYKNFPAGGILPIVAKRVNSTGSAVRAAGDLIGMY